MIKYLSQELLYSIAREANKYGKMGIDVIEVVVVDAPTAGSSDNYILITGQPQTAAFDSSE